MQEAFIAGFVKTAVDMNYNDDTIVRIFKRAMANPQMGQMFKNLPAGGQPTAPQDLHSLSTAKQMTQNPQQLAMLKQYLMQQHMQAPRI